MTDVLMEIVAKLYEGDEEQVCQLVRDGLSQNLGPSEILNGGLIAAMDRVGKDFKTGILFIPEVLIAARAMQAGDQHPPAFPGRIQYRLRREDRNRNGQGRLA